MALSDKKRTRIEQMITDAHTAFMVDVMGEDGVDKEARERLKANGVIGDRKPTQVAIHAAHTHGKMGAIASDAKMARMKPEQFWQFIQHAPPQFKQTELDAIEGARLAVGRAIVGLTVKARSEFDQAVEESKAVLRHEIALGIARDKTDAQIIRRLKTKFADMERDWKLVVRTELHNARDHGKALSIAASSDKNKLVFKLPRDTACRICKKLYLKPDGTPRVFRLLTLARNGTNLGKKHSEMKPVIGATHPACECELHEIPDGFNVGVGGKLKPSLTKALPDELSEELESMLNHTCES